MDKRSLFNFFSQHGQGLFFLGGKIGRSYKNRIGQLQCLAERRRAKAKEKERRETTKPIRVTIEETPHSIHVVIRHWDLCCRLMKVNMAARTQAAAAR